MSEQAKPPINWHLIWIIVAFVVGNVFQAGMGWGKGSGDVSHAIEQIGELKGMIGELSNKFTASDKSTFGELGRIEEHLSSNDSRIDNLERKLEASKTQR